jgi:hypothetical protein
VHFQRLYGRLCGIWLLVVCLCGCSDNPGTWPAGKLEAYVKDSLNREGMEITEITLNAAGESLYTGTAMDAGGEKLDLEVKQEPSAKRLTWDAKGNQGSFLSGSYKLE